MLLKRLAGIIPVVFGVLLLTFLLVHLVPGDPVEVMLGESATSADRGALRAELGLDQPLPLQFAAYLGKLAQGDFGHSIHSHAAISGLLAERIPATAKLALLSLVLAIAIGLPLGIVAALRYRRWPDRIASLSSLTLSAMPHFWLGPLLMLVFALWLGWLPVSGMENSGSIVLPALTLAGGLAAILTRMTRASLLEGNRRLCGPEAVDRQPVLTNSLREGEEVAVRRHDPEPIDIAAVEQVHRIDRHAHVGCALALYDVELLHRDNRMRAGEVAPALEAGLRPVAVGAADIDRTKLTQD